MARARDWKDYYAILNLHPEATEDEIRRAYRRLAFEWHPDRNPGRPEAAERFKEISEAYAVLINPTRRREYDRIGRGEAPGEVRWSREDLFRDLFADPRASRVFEELAREFERMGMRADSHFFRTTLFGGRTVITGGIFIISPFTPILALVRLAAAALRGRRAEPLPAPRGVLGMIGRAGRWLLGLPPAPSGATALASEDVTLSLPLKRAEAEHGGKRRLSLPWNGKDNEVVVTIPPGIKPGTRLRLRGKGRAAAGGRRGDLYLVIETGD